MIKFDVLDYEVLLDGEKVATFEQLADAKAWAFGSVDNGMAMRCDVINQFTGEVVYHCHAKMVRAVVEGFDD
jgi:hypothetical protein